MTNGILEIGLLAIADKVSPSSTGVLEWSRWTGRWSLVSEQEHSIEDERVQCRFSVTASRPQILLGPGRETSFLPAVKKFCTAERTLCGLPNTGVQSMRQKHLMLPARYGW